MRQRQPQATRLLAMTGEPMPVLVRKGNCSDVSTFNRYEDTGSWDLIGQLPEEFKQLVLYDAPCSAYIPTLLGLIARRGREEAMKIVKRNLANDTKAVYGDKYPL